MKKEKEEPEELSAPFWMVTFSDMVTLMLCFFVLILSFSTIELEKFKGAVESLKGALGVFSGHESPQTQKNMRVEKVEVPDDATIYQKAMEMEKRIQDLQLQDEVKVEVTGSGMLVRLGENVLFDAGTADLKPRAFPILSAISEAMRGEKQEVYVEGHTDNVPIHTRKFPSNWELSSARALSVVKYLVNVEGIPEKFLAAVGHGEHRPLVPNNSPQNRARNRRVEIFIKWQ